MNFRDKLVNLSGETQIIRYGLRGDSQSYAGRINQVGDDYVQIESLDPCTFEPDGMYLFPICEITHIDINPVPLNRSILLKSLAVSLREDDVDKEFHPF